MPTPPRESAAGTTPVGPGTLGEGRWYESVVAEEVRHPDPPVMRRVIAALLWFTAIWFGFEVLWSVVGIPRMAGPILGAAVAILVTLDPTGSFWAARDRTRSDLELARESVAKH